MKRQNVTFDSEIKRIQREIDLINARRNEWKRRCLSSAKWYQWPMTWIIVNSLSPLAWLLSLGGRR
jgi:hypothetical protein